MGSEAHSIGMSMDEGQLGSPRGRGAAVLGCLCSHPCSKPLRSSEFQVSSHIWEIITNVVIW